MKSPHRGLTARRRFWVVVFALVSLGIMAGGLKYYQYEQDHIRRNKYQELAAIADLKVRQIVEWRRERLNDANQITRGPFLRKAIMDWLQNPGTPSLQAALLERFKVEKEGGAYGNVLLADPDGRILLSVRPDPAPFSPSERQFIASAVAGRQPVLGDLFRSPKDGPVHLDVAAPVMDSQGRPLAVVVLRINADKVLYPLIKSWSTPSRTAETLLVEVEGKNVLFLNDLRHREKTALSLREPLAQTELPAVQAALGKRGMYHGRDYRNVEVLADLRPVPQSPWFMVAKVDADEILAEARYRAGIAALLAFLFILLTAAVTAYGYRQRQANLYQDLYQSEREQRQAQEEFRTTLYSIGDAVITMGTEGLVKHINPVAERLTGWLEAEALEKPLEEVFCIINEETRTAVENPAQRVLREGVVLGLANHTLLIARDGAEHPIAYSGAPIRDENGAVIGVVLVFRDQTEERQAQRALAESEERYRELFEKNSDAIMVFDAETHRFEDSNAATLSLYGYTRDEFLALAVEDISAEPDQTRALITRLVTGEADPRIPLRCQKKKDGSVFPVEISAGMYFAGGCRKIISAVRDQTERKRAEELLALQAVQQQALLDLHLLAQAPQEQILDFVLKASCTTMESKFAFIGLVDETESTMTIHRWSEEAMAQCAMDHKPILYPVSEAGSWGDCIRRRQAVLVNDYQVPHSGKKGLPEGHVPIRRFLAVPVLDGGRVVAAAAVANKAKDYTQDDVTAFTSLVDKMWEILRRRQAEEALRQTRDYLDNLINHANAPIIVWDPSFRITQFNRAFENLTGYSAQEVIGQKLDLLFPEASCEESLSKIARTSSGEYWEAVEIPILRKDGDTRIALWNSANIHAEDGATLVATIAQGHDITARKQAVQALRDERQRFLALLEEMPATVTLLAPDYTILFGNRQLREIFGDPQGRTCYEYVYGRQTPCDDCNLRDILEGQKLMEWERTFHGRIHQVYTYPFADIDGSLMILKMGIDITERKRAEEAFISLVSQAPMGIFIIQNGKFIVINPGFEAITGYRKEELLGQESACLAIPSHKEMVSREATKRLKGESSTPFEFQFVTKSGEIRWGIETIAPTQFEETRASLGYFMDITEHKQLEEQFLQAQKMEAVARLAGGVAHDFNNILSVIFGYGDLMNQTLRPQDPLAGYLAKIREASDRAAVLTSQLLAFCRKTILAPQILNLNDQLAGVEHMLERLIGEDIEIRMVLDPALEPVKADPGQVDQIVMNLAINARDAMPSGGNLTLETANVYLDEDYARGHTYVTPGHYVMLAVTDNGQGMDAETQAHVFEPFFTTKELGRGTGLGLSTVYGIVKQSGGHIAVYSEVGQGTTFKVYLPRVQEAVAAVSEAKPLAMDLHGSETILVVEDEDMLREIIGRSLKIYGYSVLKARHGGEALLLCERHPEPIHLMLTDVVMPNMNGRELADRLAPLRPDMKVLYMSGYTDNAIVHHGVLETDIFFVQKPFRTKKLIEKIREILGESLPKP